MARVAGGASHPIARAPAPKIAALLSHEAREHHIVHLRCPIDEARLPSIAVDPFENRVFGVAARAVELNGDIGRPMQRVGDVHFGHRDFLARVIALVELPCGMHHQKTPDLDLLRHLAELDLHALAVGKARTEAFALSIERLASPSQRIQCVSRAGPSLICVTRNPSPTFISTFSSGTSRPSNTSSQWPPCSSGPMIGMRRRMRQPGWSR